MWYNDKIIKVNSPGQLRLGLAAALLVITVSAFACFAPVWQPGYSTVGTTGIVQVQPVPVNLNTADANTLCTLPGIGEKKAEAIISYRAEHGPFTTAAQLAEVDGISQRMADELEKFICLK